MLILDVNLNLTSVSPVSPTVVLTRVMPSSHMSLMISINTSGTFSTMNTIHNFLPYSLYFSCRSIIQNMGSVVELPFWNQYWLPLIFTIFLSLSSITFLKSLAYPQLPFPRASVTGSEVSYPYY